LKLLVAGVISGTKTSFRGEFTAASLKLKI